MGNDICGMGDNEKISLKKLPLNENQKSFCREYIVDWNATRAYHKVYGGESNEATRVKASQLLTNPNIKAYITYIQDRLEEASGISRLKVLQEYAKMAFSSIAHYHNTWIEKNKFEDLTDEQKAAIQEISTKEVKLYSDGEEIGIQEYVKIKLYDKQKALEAISKMLGYDAPLRVRLEQTTKPTIIFGDEKETEEKDELSENSGEV